MSITTAPQYWTVSGTTGNVVGPLTKQDLMKLLGQGKLSPSSPICAEGAQEWTQLHTILQVPGGQVPTPASAVVPPPVAAYSTYRQSASPSPYAIAIPFALGMAATAVLTLLISQRFQPTSESKAENLGQSSERVMAAPLPSDRRLPAADRAEATSEEVAKRGSKQVGNSFDVQHELTKLREEFLSQKSSPPSPPADRDAFKATPAKLASGDSAGVRATPVSLSTRPIVHEAKLIAPGKPNVIAADPDPVLTHEQFIPHLRQWQDSTGSYSIQARLDCSDHFYVSLVKPCGKTIEVPRGRLCLEDAVYVEQAERLAPDIIRATRFVSTTPLPRQRDQASTLSRSSASTACISRPRPSHELDRERFAQYQQRRAERRTYALDRRRQINSTRGPHVYRTAIAMQVNPLGYNAIQAGWVRQPPIPRPYYGYGYGARRSYSQSCAPRRNSLVNY